MGSASNSDRTGTEFRDDKISGVRHEHEHGGREAQEENGRGDGAADVMVHALESTDQFPCRRMQISMPRGGGRGVLICQPGTGDGGGGGGSVLFLLPLPLGIKEEKKRAWTLSRVRQSCRNKLSSIGGWPSRDGKTMMAAPMHACWEAQRRADDVPGLGRRCAWPHDAGGFFFSLALPLSLSRPPARPPLSPPRW
jgi:hypothetical protein